LEITENTASTLQNNTAEHSQNRINNPGGMIYEGTAKQIRQMDVQTVEDFGKDRLNTLLGNNREASSYTTAVAR
jgi:hypothetical protein